VLVDEAAVVSLFEQMTRVLRLLVAENVDMTIAGIAGVSM
jgi:hypothetical protein